jgi:hypothetical protein
VRGTALKLGRAALLALVIAGCGGAEGGVLIEVSQSPDWTGQIGRLELFVGTPDEGGGFAGTASPVDEIQLVVPLAERPHTIQLVRAAGMDDGTPVRVAVVGGGEGPASFAMLDLPEIPDDVFLRYDLVLQPTDGVVTTDSGCVALPDGVVVAAIDDHDCDSYVTDQDCDDTDPAVHPGAYDACDAGSLGVDDDCTGTADDGDADADGATCLSDCDDQDGTRFPENREDCVDGIDGDCDLEIDEGVPEICDDDVDNDCNPLTPDIGVTEICGDGYDNDCDAAVDEGRDGNPDVDDDGFLCDVDCDDDVGTVHPGATEVCNETDDDCDHAIDEAVNQDGDGALCAFDCDDMDPRRFPGNNEVCDTADNDCDGLTIPAPSPCAADASDPCHYGFRACDENAGVYAEECLAQPLSADLPDPVCTDLGVCDASPDGLACAADHVCTQMMADGGEPCAAATHGLSSEAQQCLWVILGGRTQQGWTVGLLAAGSTTPQPAVMTCDATFEVEGVPAGLQPGVFAIALFIGDTMVYDHMEIFAITPGPRGPLCALPSLQCSGN